MFKLQLENVAIANALKLEAAQCRAIPIRFNTSPVASLKSLTLTVDLEHEPRVALYSEILCTKFKFSQAIRSWNMTIFFTLIRRVTLWPWPLTPWPWTFVVRRASCAQTLCKIWAKSNNPLQSYWRFSTLSPWIFWAGPNLVKGSQGCVDRSAPNLVGILSDNHYNDNDNDNDNRYLYSAPYKICGRRQSLKMVKISCSVSKPQQLKFERWSAIRPKIALFDPL